MTRLLLSASALLGLLLIVGPTPAEAGRNRAVQGRAQPPALAPQGGYRGRAPAGPVGRGTFGRGAPQSARSTTQPFTGQSVVQQAQGRRGLSSQRHIGSRAHGIPRQPAVVRSPQSLQPGQFGYRGSRGIASSRARAPRTQVNASNLRGQWTDAGSARSGRTPFGRTVASPLGDTRANQGLLGRGNAALRSHLTGSTSAGSNRAGSNRAGSNAAGRLRDGLSSLRSGRQGASQGALGRGNDALGRSGGARGRTGGSFAGSGSNQSAGGGGRPALPTPAIDRSVGVDRGFDRNSFGSGRGRLGRTRGNERGGRFHFGLGRPRHVPSSLGAQSPALRTGRSVYAGRRGHGRHGRSYRGGRWRSLWSSHYYYAPSTTVIEYVHVPEPLPYLESVPYVEVEPYIPQEPYVAPVPYVPNEHIGPDLPAAGLPSPQAYQPDAFDRGAEAFEAGQYREAHEWFDKAVRADPRDGEAWLGLMHTSLMLDRYADAATAIARVADLGGIGPGYDLDPREVYGDDPVAYDAAVVRLERFVARYPRDTDALLTIAFIRVARGDHALANADLQRLGGLDRTNPMVQVLANAMRPAPAQQGANAQQR